MSDRRLKWICIIWDECSLCGGDLWVRTTATKEQHVYDGDTAKCASCGERGWVSADEDDCHVHMEEAP